MQTILDLPEELLVQVEAAAEVMGQSMQGYVAEALRERLAQAAVAVARNGSDAPGWLRLAGVWKEHAAELSIVEAAIEEAFEQIDEELWV